MGPDFLADCVIAQQYSSRNFVSLHFHYYKEKFGTPLKMVLFIFKEVRKSVIALLVIVEVGEFL
jgi:uncharacterized membrane protein